MDIVIRSVSTVDVKIAQRALEKIGFKTVTEGDAIDAYWVRLSVPENSEFSHGECTVMLRDHFSKDGGGSENVMLKNVTLRW